jgi:hypothetical protein
MKTTLLLCFALVFSISVLAQQHGVIPVEKQKITRNASLKPAILEPTGPNTTLFRQGDGPRTLFVNEVQVGTTVYDLQSNACIQNRLYVYPDGTAGAVWTQGFTPASYSERGTGYNYFDGTSWGEFPTARIETRKTGWPSYAPLGDGEMVISHGSVGALNFARRATRGSGAWTNSDIPGTTDYAWPRAISNNGIIHIIVNTYATYEGLTNALVYLRSTDNGATWTTPAILPGMDAASFTLTTGFDGFGGDEYIWAEPKGDTIAFAFGHFLGGLWIMKSFDNGLTWNRTTVYEFPAFTGEDSPDATTYDENFAIALDNQGQVHLATTRYKMVHYNSTSASWNYYPYTDGLVYWNESMPVIDTAIYNNLDSLENRGMLIGYMLDYNNNGEIEFPEVGADEVPWGDYRYVGPTSFPQMVVDDNNNIFVSYSALREDLVNAGANPNTQLYRHLYVVSKMNDKAEWMEPVDLNDDVIHAYDEVVWASMVGAADGNLHFLCQMDAEPGTTIGADADEPGENYMTYITFPTFVGLKPAVDIAKDVVISPNPASEYANVQVSLQDNMKVEVNIFDAMGRLVKSTNYGRLAAGTHILKTDTGALPSGFYLFSIKAGANQTTQKVIVK